MRNLRQYPVTLDEAIAAVEQALQDHESQMARRTLKGRAPVGGIQGVALQDAVNRLKRLQFAASS